MEVIYRKIITAYITLHKQKDGPDEQQHYRHYQCSKDSCILVARPFRDQSQTAGPDNGAMT
jgi:hypothetical protein